MTAKKGQSRGVADGMHFQGAVEFQGGAKENDRKWHREELGFYLLPLQLQRAQQRSYPLEAIRSRVLEVEPGFSENKNLWHVQRRTLVGGGLTGGRPAYLGLCKSESWHSILMIDTQNYGGCKNGGDCPEILSLSGPHIWGIQLITSE